MIRKALLGSVLASALAFASVADAAYSGSSPTPVAKGGTGATSATGAAVNLGLNVNGAVKVTSGGAASQAACADLSDGGLGGCTAKVVTGSLTPTLAYQTAGTSSFAYTTQQGNYVCVAGVVTGWARVVFTPTNGTASGALGWNNPPYDTSTNHGDVSVGMGTPASFTGGWSSITANYEIASFGTNFFNFQNNAGNPGASLGTTNSTTGTSKEVVWTFNYLTSTGTC